MKVYDLMMALAQLPPYAEVGVQWDDALADIDAIVVVPDGTVVLDADSYASMDIRKEKRMPA